VSPDLPGAASLIPAAVLAIREAYAAGGVSQVALGQRYRVTQIQISRIVRGEDWPWVGGPRTVRGRAWRRVGVTS
jgi:hypothetical protein